MNAFTLSPGTNTKHEVYPNDGLKFTQSDLEFFLNTKQELTIADTYDGRLIIYFETNGGPKNVAASLLRLNGDEKPIFGKALVCKKDMIWNH